MFYSMKFLLCTSVFYFRNLQFLMYMFKEALYNILCGVNRLGDSGVNRLGDTSAFVTWRVSYC